MEKDKCIRPDNAAEHTLQWTRAMLEGRITQCFLVVRSIVEEPYNCIDSLDWSRSSPDQVNQFYLFADFSDFQFSGDFHW